MVYLWIIPNIKKYIIDMNYAPFTYSNDKRFQKYLLLVDAFVGQGSCDLWPENVYIFGFNP